MFATIPPRVDYQLIKRADAGCKIEVRSAPLNQESLVIGPTFRSANDGNTTSRCVRGDSNVPRYFFHFSDGKRQFTDTSGHELSGLAAARAHATNHVRELKTAMCDPHIVDLSGWSMTVADANGKSVFTVSFDRKPPPSAG